MAKQPSLSLTCGDGLCVLHLSTLFSTAILLFIHENVGLKTTLAKLGN